jgi:hypothetical protein
MSVRCRRRFLNPAAHWRQESGPDAWRRRQFNRISTHLCGAGRQNSLADLRAPAPGTSSSSRMNTSSPWAWPKPCKTPAQLCLARSRLSTRRSRNRVGASHRQRGCGRQPWRNPCLPRRGPAHRQEDSLSSLPQAMRTTFFGTDILKLRIASNPICSRRWRKRWSRPCRSHDDSGAKTLV